MRTVSSKIDHFMLSFFIKAKNFSETAAPKKALDSIFNEKKSKNKNDFGGFCSKKSENLNILVSKVNIQNQKWKKKEKDSTNKSTLSLHISAYENSVEVGNGLKDSVESLRTNSKKIKYDKSLKGIFGSDFAFKDTFEIPRQQSDKVTEPEVSKFSASQKLLNPNEMPSSNDFGGVRPITRPANGKSYSHGALYNAHEEFFTGTSLFCSDIQNKLTRDSICGGTFQYIFEESINQKREKLGIDAELGLSIFSGLIKADAQFKCLNSGSVSDRKTTYSLVYNFTTEHQEINLNDNSVRSLMTIDGINDSPATHVVRAVQYGGYAIVEITYERKENESEELAKGMVKAAVFALKASAEIHSNKIDSQNFERLQINVSYYGFLPDGETLPQTVEAAAAFLTKVPFWIKNSNGGKGVPISYELVPLRFIQSTLNLMKFGGRIYNEIDESIITRVFKVFDMITERERILCKREEQLKKEYDITSIIKEEKLELEKFRLKFKNELRKISSEIKRGEKPKYALNFLLKKISYSHMVFGCNSIELWGAFERVIILHVYNILLEGRDLLINILREFRHLEFVFNTVKPELSNILGLLLKLPNELRKIVNVITDGQKRGSAIDDALGKYLALTIPDISSVREYGKLAEAPNINAEKMKNFQFRRSFIVVDD